MSANVGRCTSYTNVLEEEHSSSLELFRNRERLKIKVFFLFFISQYLKGNYLHVTTVGIVDANKMTSKSKKRIDVL